MVGISLHMDDLRNGVLGFVAERVDDDAATDGTVRAGAAGLAGSRNLQALGLSVYRGEIESESGNACATQNSTFQKGPAGEVHGPLANHDVGRSFDSPTGLLISDGRSRPS